MNLFSKSIVGLDIGTSSVKAIHLKKNGNQWNLLSLGIQEIPQEALGSSAQNPSKTSLADVIKKLFKENGIKTKRVVTSLSGDSVIIRDRKSVV